jgi:hypothetical protein
VIKVIMRNDQSEEVANLAGTQKNLLMTIQGKDGDPTGMSSARFEDIFKVHPNDVARLLPGQCFVVYNRYATKVHSQMVGTVVHLKQAIEVYRKPTAGAQPEEDAEPQQRPQPQTPPRAGTTEDQNQAHIRTNRAGSAAGASEQDEI